MTVELRTAGMPFGRACLVVNVPAWWVMCRAGGDVPRGKGGHFATPLRRVRPTVAAERFPCASQCVAIAEPCGSSAERPGTCIDPGPVARANDVQLSS